MNDTERTSLCLGTMDDLMRMPAPLDVALASMKAWTDMVAESCSRCSRTIVATISDGSHAHRKAATERILRLNICDACFNALPGKTSRP